MVFTTRPKNIIGTVVQVPADWTREKDVDEFLGSFFPYGSDYHAAGIERIHFHREEVYALLHGSVRDFGGSSDYLSDFASSWMDWNRLSPGALADALMALIRNSSPDERCLIEIEKELHRAREAFELCDAVLTRCVLEGKEVWLTELGAVINELRSVKLMLNESIHRAFKWQPRLIVRPADPWSRDMPQIEQRFEPVNQPSPSVVTQSTAINMTQNSGSQNGPEKDPANVGKSEFISWIEEGAARESGIPKRLEPVEAPVGWTLERDRRFMERIAQRYQLKVGDPYDAAIDRICHEISGIDGFLDDLIDDIRSSDLTPDSDEDVPATRLGVSLSRQAKIELLISYIRKGPWDFRQVAWTEDLLRLTLALCDLSDNRISRYIQQGRQGWLVELAAVIDNCHLVTQRLGDEIDRPFGPPSLDEVLEREA